MIKEAIEAIVNDGDRHILALRGTPCSRGIHMGVDDSPVEDRLIEVPLLWKRTHPRPFAQQFRVTQFDVGFLQKGRRDREDSPASTLWSGNEIRCGAAKGKLALHRKFEVPQNSFAPALRHAVMKTDERVFGVDRRTSSFWMTQRGAGKPQALFLGQERSGSIHERGIAAPCREHLNPGMRNLHHHVQAMECALRLG